MGEEETHDDVVEFEVRKARLGLLAKSVVRTVPANVINCLLLSALIVGHSNMQLHAAWAALIVLSSFARLAVMWPVHKSEDKNPSDRAFFIYLGLTGLTGAAWGATPFLLAADASAIAVNAVALVVAGMAAGCAATVADRRSVLAFVLPTMGLFALHMVLEQTWQSYFVVALSVIFTLIIVGASTTSIATLIDALEANFRVNEMRRQTSSQAAAMSRLAEYNEAAAMRAESKVKASAAVLSNMSHQLRTPLNSVVGMAQLLQDQNLTPDQRSMARQIQASGEEVEQLLFDVLEVARLETGRLDINLQDVNCKSIADKIRIRYNDVAKEKGLRFDVSCDGALQTPMRGDIDRILQVTSIYIDNALRFTREGYIRVHVYAEAEACGSKARLRVDVRDTGEGVPQDLIGELFDAFISETMNPLMRESRTGLGLHLAKRMTLLMDGNVGYQPNDDAGSCFWFELKTKLSAAADKYADGEELTLDRRRRRVLVGESNSARQSVLLGNLKSMDCAVACASSFEELETALDAAAYDAIILGQELDGREIDQVASEIASLASTAAMTPILRLSGSLSAPLLESAREVLISTPITREGLESGLDLACRPGFAHKAGEILKAS